jgi:hypothetical protein
VYFRQPFGPVRRQGWPSGGCGVRFDSTHTVREKTGTLYIDNRLAVAVTENPIEADQWFTLDVVANGPQLVVKVNGKTTADYVEAGPLARVGQIALEVQDASSVVHFRKVEIKELPAGGPLLRWSHPKGRFDQVKGDVWIETLEGPCKFWRQIRPVQRLLFTAEFSNADRRPALLRLHRDFCEGKIGDGRWARWQVGRWEVRERPTPVKKAPLARPGEWVPLFNGKDLSGWNIAGGVRASWEYEDGALRRRSRGPLPSLLFSERADYDHFHLRMEIMGNAEARGWILLRCGAPQDGPGGTPGYGVHLGSWHDQPVGTGHLALTAHRTLESLLCAAPPQNLKPDAWFPLEIIALGNRIRVLIDGKSAVDYTDPNETFTAGRLGMWFKPGSAVGLRKAEIRELPPPVGSPPLPDVVGDAKGFVPLFNGKDLTGWNVRPPKADNWEVKDGIAVCRRGPDSYLVSERNYQDFHLRVEARINGPGNSGVFFWSVPGKPQPGGVEAEILGRRITGSLLEWTPEGQSLWRELAPDHLMAANEWFALEVIAQGNRIKTLVNGKPAASKTLWVKQRAQGPIVLQHFGAKTVIEFRKVEIKEIPSTR